MAATAPKIPPHTAISRRTLRLRMYLRGAGTPQTPPTQVAAETLGPTKKNQKARASLISFGPRTRRETIRRQHPPSPPTDLSTLKNNNHSHRAATKQSTLLGRCKVPPSPPIACRETGVAPSTRTAESMVVPAPMLPVVWDPHPKAQRLWPLSPLQRMPSFHDVKVVLLHHSPKTRPCPPRPCSAALQPMVRVTLTLLT